MESGWLARMRWRRRGAWLWPAFVLTLPLDAVVGHLLPPAGESQRLLGAAILAGFLNLFAVVLLSWPLGVLVRRRRPSLPRVVARDYGGTLAILGVSALLLGAGVVHRPSIAAHRRAKRDAIVRAQAWIGDRAPPEFRHNLSVVDTYAIEPGRMYRVCIPSGLRARFYCVIVRTNMPFAQSVRFDGYEANSIFAQGAG